jgi:peptide deformylase
MALLTILEYPDPRLRTRARPVDQVTPELRQLAADMLETMYAAPGIGLAATQVDVHQRLIVVDVSEAKDAPVVLFNPEIVAKEGCEPGEEGCLSVPGFTETVERASRITVRYLDRDGVTRELSTDGLLAVCIQHEMDHLDGKLFVDYLSELKRQRLKKRAAKSRRHPPAANAPVAAKTPPARPAPGDRAPVI